MVRRERAVRNSLDKYLGILNAESTTSHVKGIIDRIVAVVRAKQGTLLPVKLSAIVPEFSMEPVPRYEIGITHGRLEYNLVNGLFEIILPERARPLSTHNFLPDLEWFAHQSARARFTYAHEVAHRFFYVQGDGSWRRALEVAVEGEIGSARLASIRSISAAEEAACNRIAGEVLVPQDLLSPLAKLNLVDVTQSPNVTFSKRISELARLFQVSLECMMVQVQRAIDRRSLEVGSNFVALTIARSTTKGGGVGTMTKPRIASSLVPPTVDQSLASIFTGLAVDNLGAEFSEMIRNIMDRDAQGGDFSCSLRTKLSRFEISSKLSGYWISRGPSNMKRVFIWGNVAP